MSRTEQLQQEANRLRNLFLDAGWVPVQFKHWETGENSSRFLHRQDHVIKVEIAESHVYLYQSTCEGLWKFSTSYQFYSPDLERFLENNEVIIRRPING
jgi:hypothetical protein